MTHQIHSEIRDQDMKHLVFLIEHIGSDDEEPIFQETFFFLDEGGWDSRSKTYLNKCPDELSILSWCKDNDKEDPPIPSRLAVHVDGTISLRWRNYDSLSDWGEKLIFFVPTLWGSGVDALLLNEEKQGTLAVRVCKNHVFLHPSAGESIDMGDDNFIWKIMDREWETVPEAAGELSFLREKWGLLLRLSLNVGKGDWWSCEVRLLDQDWIPSQIFGLNIYLKNLRESHGCAAYQVMEGNIFVD